MQENFFIKKIAVLGAGVMGAQIAAHCINAGIVTLLYDLADANNGNDLVMQAIAHLQKLTPPPLAIPQIAELLQARNYGEHLADLGTCDLIIEAIGERSDWKESLYQLIAPHLNKKAILVSNTSGLSINALRNSLPKDLRNRFCGMHFFNPPRYMHLVELIPTTTTPMHLLNHLETWLTSYLGKGVVRAKDLPNFIANRIGVFSLLSIWKHAEIMKLGFDEVDALTGTLIGRPKSATFRTMDVVGLDTMLHVVDTMHQFLPNDPWHPLFNLPEWFKDLIKLNHLGQKTGQGIYRKNGKDIQVYDLSLSDYRLATGKINDHLKELFKIKGQAQFFQALITSTDQQARFLAACYIDLWHYSAYHLSEIANNVRDVDLALRWGFGWQQGPFAMWQHIGFKKVHAAIINFVEDNLTLSSVGLPLWLTKINDFYQEEGAYNPQQQVYDQPSKLAVYRRQFFPEQVTYAPTKAQQILFENEGVLLSHLPDELALLNFKSKANTISHAVIDGCQQALAIATQKCQGLILYQHDANNFGGGADLQVVINLIAANKMAALENMITEFQQLVMQLKYAPIPVIAALRGRALGGSCELMLHCAAIVAAFEAYPGLVETGVGLIPAGGGCKEMAIRAAHATKDNDLLLFLQPYFQQIATGFVANNAIEAQQKGYLRNQDCWVMHKNEVLFAACAKVKALLAANYQAPLPRTFKIAGLEGHACLQVSLINWLERGKISQHDYFIADKLAYVLCGGELKQGTIVDENWLLRLEKEAFMRLASEPLSQARIQYLLTNSKYLRN